MPEMMEALVADRYGGPEVLQVRSVGIPSAGTGQLLVSVEAASLNPADLRLLSGTVAAYSPLAFPHVMGSDLAGTVVQAGAGVTRFRAGDRVFGTGLPRSTPAAIAQLTAAPPSFTTGAGARFAVVDEQTPAIASLPGDLEPWRAASLPTTGLTALSLMRAARFSAGDTTLVLGSAGGVGVLLIPLLASRGVRVVAVGRAEDEPFLLGLGAGQVIAGRAGDIGGQLRALFPAGVPSLVNLAVPGDQLERLEPQLADGAQVLTITFPPPDETVFAKRGITVSTVIQQARPGDLEELARQAQSGSLPVTVAQRYPLADGAHAYRDLERRHVRGKLVLDLTTG